MTTQPMPANVVQFVKQHVQSLLQLESLLLVFEAGDNPRTAASLAAEMYVPADAVAAWLDGFSQAGFCSRDQDGYCVPIGDARKLLAEVAEAYVRRPVSISRLIFGSGRNDLIELSEAFRLRKDP